MKQNARQLAAKHGMLFAEVSSLSGKGVEEAFTRLVLDIVTNEVSLVHLKDVYMFFLLGSNEDFDDDLLLDAIDLLTDL
jgi:hypothetical protein